MTRLAPAKHDRPTIRTDVPRASDETTRQLPAEEPAAKTAPMCGYGECSRCECRKYEDGDGDVCSNCGHGYHQHW